MLWIATSLTLLAMTWVAPLAMTWVALLAMTERAYDCNDGGRFACNGESHVTARQDAEAVQACLN